MPRPESAVLAAVQFIEHLIVMGSPLLKKGVLKIGEKWSGVILAIAVIALTGGIGALLIGLSNYLHPKIGLAVLLYFACTTLTMRSFGEKVYGVFKWLQEKNLSSAQKDLSLIMDPIMCPCTESMTQSKIIRDTVMSVSGNSVHGVVAPLLYLLLGGVPLAMAYQAINTLYFSLGQRAEHKRSPLRTGWDAWGGKLYNLVNFIPARITGVLMAIGAAFLFGTGLKTFMILLRNGLQYPSPNTEMPGVVLAGAIGMTLRSPSTDVEVLPFFPLHENEMDEAELHHIIDAIKLMGVVACVMLIVCMMT